MLKHIRIDHDVELADAFDQHCRQHTVDHGDTPLNCQCGARRVRLDAGDRHLPYIAQHGREGTRAASHIQHPRTDWDLLGDHAADFVRVQLVISIVPVRVRRRAQKAACACIRRQRGLYLNNTRHRVAPSGCMALRLGLPSHGPFH